MAIQAPTVWSDIYAPISFDGQGAIKIGINAEAVAVSIDNILRTRKMERVMLPEFGSGLDSLLFENISDALADALADEIKTAITTWDPRVQVNSIHLKSDPDRNFVNIHAFFSILGLDKIFEYKTSI